MEVDTRFCTWCGLMRNLVLLERGVWVMEAEMGVRRLDLD